MPLLNPAGMQRATRANARGVDLMRNAPVDSRERVTFLLGGQRVSPWLPWYRGAAGAPMEKEVGGRGASSACGATTSAGSTYCAAPGRAGTSPCPEATSPMRRRMNAPIKG